MAGHEKLNHRLMKKLGLLNAYEVFININVTIQN